MSESIAQTKSRSLQKVLGVAFGVAIIVGGTIGSGILRAPGEVAAALPSTAWFMAAWILGGIYALCGALTLAELAVIIPKSGGEYQFARRAFGEYAGFVIGWTDWISICAAGASIAIAFGELANEQVRWLAGAETGIAITVTIAFVALHLIGVRTSDRAQQILSVMKTVGLLVIAVICFLPLRAVSVPQVVESVPHTLPAGLALLTTIVVALQGIIYTCDGWNGAIYFTGELRDPARQIPRVMASGVVTVLVVYLAINAACLYVLGIDVLAGTKFPATAAVRAVLGGSAESVVGAVLAVSLLGAFSAGMLMASRVPHAMASDGLMPKAAAQTSAGGTPTTALVASGVCTIFFVTTGTFSTIIAIAALFYVFKYCSSFAALFMLRWREPNLDRPYRAIGYPVIPALLLLASVGFVISNFVTDRTNSTLAAAILLASYPAFRLSRHVAR